MTNNPERLVGEFDASKWAETFVAMVKEQPSIASDEGTMLGWFANAIMAGYDRGQADVVRAGQRLRQATPYVSALHRQQ